MRSGTRSNLAEPPARSVAGPKPRAPDFGHRCRWRCKTQGLRDVWVAYVDGLIGFPRPSRWSIPARRQTLSGGGRGHRGRARVGLLAEFRLRYWEYVIVVFDCAYRNTGSSTAHTLSKIRPCASARGCKPSSWISAGSPATPSSRNGISGMS